MAGQIGAGEERKAAATGVLGLHKWPRSTGATLGCHGQSSGWRRGRGRGRGTSRHNQAPAAEPMAAAAEPAAAPAAAAEVPGRMRAVQYEAYGCSAAGLKVNSARSMA